jgi:hypothetical protein
MQTSEIKAAVNDLLDIVENGRGRTEENVAALEVALDRLAWMRHFVKFNFEADHPNPPRKEYQAVRALAVQRFPDFGTYNTVLDFTVNVAETELAVGDAIDDITDIVLDLYDVAWCWMNTSEADALWHFENGFWSHWGEHLRNLQLYIHEFGRGT